MTSLKSADPSSTPTLLDTLIDLTWTYSQYKNLS